MEAEESAAEPRTRVSSASYGERSGAVRWVGPRSRLGEGLGAVGGSERGVTARARAGRAAAAASQRSALPPPARRGVSARRGPPRRLSSSAARDPLALLS